MVFIVLELVFVFYAAATSPDEADDGEKKALFVDFITLYRKPLRDLLVGTRIAAVACLVHHHSHQSAHFHQQDADTARQAGVNSKRLPLSCHLILATARLGSYRSAILRGTHS